MASEHDPQELVRRFLVTTGYVFLDDLIDQINEQLTDNNELFPAFNIFNPNESNSMMHRFDQLKVLCNHYGCDITDVYDNDVKKADALLSIAEQQLESEEFFQEFDDTSLHLTNNVKSEARRRWNRGEMKQGEMHDYITTNKPSSSGVYAAMCKEGCSCHFPSHNATI